VVEGVDSIFVKTWAVIKETKVDQFGAAITVRTAKFGSAGAVPARWLAVQAVGFLQPVQRLWPGRPFAYRLSFR